MNTPPLEAVTTEKSLLLYRGDEMVAAYHLKDIKKMKHLSYGELNSTMKKLGITTSHKKAVKHYLKLL